MYHTEFGRRLRSQSSGSTISRNQSHESLLIPSTYDRSNHASGSRLGKRSSVDFSSSSSSSIYPRSNAEATTSAMTLDDDDDPFEGSAIKPAADNRPRTPKLYERERPRTPGRGRNIVQGDRSVPLSP